MSQANLPARPSLEYLKKLAKKRVIELRADGTASKLADVQRDLAREYGFASWRKLKSHIESLQQNQPVQTAKILEFFDAIRAKDLDRAKQMLDADPRLSNAAGEDKTTPLGVAVEHDHRIVRLLLDYGADTTTRFMDSAHSPLSWALTLGSFKAAEVLMNAGVKPDLFCAAGLNAVDALPQFFNSDGYAMKSSSTTGSSRFAGGFGSPRLPSPPNDPIEVASDALYIAARNGQVDAVKFLLSKKVDLSFKAYMGGNPLHWAYFSGSRQCIDLLLSAGADTNARDQVLDATPRAFGICVPCNWGMPGKVKQLLAQDRALVNINEARRTPLHEAARAGNVEIVNILLAAGADPSAKDRDGRTPRLLAEDAGKTDVVALLSN